MHEATASVWKQLAEMTGGPEPHHGGIWEALRTHLNPALYHPVRSPEVVSIPLATRHGQPYHILTNRRHHTYLRLGSEEHHIWSLMDGTRSVKDLVIEYFTKFGTLAFGLIGQLVVHLKRAHMLVDAPTNPFTGVRRALERRRWHFAPLLLWQIITGQRTLMIRQVDGAIEWLYRHGARILYTRPLQVLYAVVSAIGGWLFIAHLRSERFQLFQVSGSYAKGLLLLYVLNYASIAVHELAHALTCKHYGARVNSAGVMLYFGMPAFYIDTTDIWTKPARARIATSWAGPYSGLILAGLCSILVQLIPAMPVSPILHRLAFLWILILVFNLIPLLELDGYFMLIDWLEIPMLRRKALIFVRRGLWPKLRRRERFTRQERLLGWFGVLSLGFSGVAILLALKFWQRRLGPVIVELWGGGVGSKIVLALLLLALALPLIVGLGGQVVVAGRAATGWAWTRWNRPRRRTLQERVALLRLVQFLSPLSEDQFPEIAARMRRATFRADEPVVRQGEAGDRFYLIESGTANVVVDRMPARALLTAGDYFGEVALLYRVPRTATVLALTPLSALWLRKGDFDRLLADHVAASVQIDQAINTLDHLRAFPVFAPLPSRELAELASHLKHERFPAGATVVEAGERGETFYLIDSGQAEVVVNGRRVRIIGRGDYFGEIALILDVPRTATVRALTPLEVFKLDRADFDRLVQTTLAQLAGTLGEVGRERLAATGSPRTMEGEDGLLDR